MAQITGGDKMPTFSDDKSYEKFKKETEAFSSSSKISGDEKNKSGNPIKGKSPEIVNKYGYRITNLTENKTKTKAEDTSELELEDVKDNNDVSDKADSDTPYVHSTPLFRTHTVVSENDMQNQTNDEFVHFDFKDESKMDQFQENVFGHAKSAQKTHDTSAGGGAQITASFDKKGHLKSKIVLNKGKERTDTKGFVNKFVLFGDAAENARDYFKTEENETLSSFTDKKVETIFLHDAKRHLRKSYRYRDIAKEEKKDIKQLKKEIRQEEVKKEKNETDNKTEDTDKNKRVEDYFKSSNGQFSDEQRPFLVPIEQKFGERGMEGREETLFLKVNEKNPENTGTPTNQSQQSSSKKESGNDVAGELTRQEKLEQSKSQHKAAKKEERKEVKKAATRTAVAKMLESKKDLHNQVGDLSGQTSGDLLKDGSAGLLTTVVNTFKQSATHVAKKIGLSLMKTIASLITPLIIPICFVFLIVTITMSTFAAVGGLLGSDGGDETYENVDVTGDGYVYSSLSDEQIEDIIQALYDNYDDFSSDQEQVIRYGLTKVGCAYDQEYHGNCNVNIFDCSSLAYRSYRSIGVNISNNGAYSAAEECHAMMDAGKTITGDLKPGDLIFYGNSNNGRYMGIYHVAIYVGRVNGVDKMVEARGTRWGVVYGDVRTANIVNISRPLM